MTGYAWLTLDHPQGPPPTRPGFEPTIESIPCRLDRKRTSAINGLAVWPKPDHQRSNHRTRRVVNQIQHGIQVTAYIVFRYQ